jgi:hypothetical protein
MRSTIRAAILASVGGIALWACGGATDPVFVVESQRSDTGERSVDLTAPSSAALAFNGPDVTRQNAECERCHTEIAAEWRASAHREAWSDPVFLAAYAIEPLAFCRACHAPEADLARLDDPARHLGVGCISCHSVDDQESHRLASSSASTTHPATTKQCDGCHQFDFPEPQDALMQSTVNEHAASPQRDKPCASCHMTKVEGAARPHRNHTFGIRDEGDMIASALQITVARKGARAIVIALKTTDKVGHAVPTGDMFRRLEVRARVSGAEPREEGATVVLARQFRMKRDEHENRRIQTGDLRVPANGEARVAEIAFGSEITAKPIEWEVVYRRMGPEQAGLFGVELDRDEIVVARGVLGAR